MMSFGRMGVVAVMAAGLTVTRAAVVADGTIPLGSALCTASAQAQEAEPTGIFHGVGVVKAIDPATGWLTINHQDIKGFMPAMEMVFRTRPPTLVAGLNVGDKVAFDIVAENYTIVGVTVIDRAK
jgi:Cu/Ag efflux protein CusF